MKLLMSLANLIFLKKIKINLTDEQIHLNWDVPGQDVESVFGDKLEVIDEKYSSKFTTYNDQIIYFEDTYIRSYNIETQEKKVLYNLGDIAIGYINKIQVVNGNLYYYDKDGSCKLTLTTSVPTWTRLSAEKYLFIDNNEDIYYLSNGKLKLLNTETVLLGNKVIGRIDENLYTVDTSKNIIYVYNGTELKKSLDLSTVNKDIAEYGYDVGNFTIVNNHIIFKFTYNGYVYALDKELNLKYNKQIDDTSRITIICEDEDLLVNEYGIYSKNYEIPPLRMSVSNFSSCGNYYIFDYNKDRFTQVSCKIEKQDLINTLFAQVYQY